MAVTIKVQGHKKLKKRLDKALKGMGNKPKKMANMGAAINLERWVKKNFQANGRLHDDSSLAWKPLKPSTIKARRQGKKKNLSEKILRDTGNLQSRWDTKATVTYGELKSRQNYSHFHEEGTKRIPQRKILPEADQGLDIVIPAYEKMIKKAVR